MLSRDECDSYGYHLNPRLIRYFMEYGPFDRRFTDIGYHAGSESGTVFVVCPGTSLDDIDVEALKERRTIGVNRAGFLFDGLWVVAECRFMMGLCEYTLKTSARRRAALDRRMVLSPRAAVWLLWEEAEKSKHSETAVFLAKSVHLSMAIERGEMPMGADGAGTITALLVARTLGYSTAILVGADMKKNRGRMYSEKVPKFRTDAKRAKLEQYTDQPSDIVRCLPYLDGIEIINASRRSKDLLPFPYVDYKDALKWSATKK